MNIRTTTEHEDDFVPVLIWFVTSMAVGWIGGYVAGEILKALGYTHRITAEVVGGGQSTTIHPISGEWYGGMIGVVVVLLVFGGWWVRDWWNT